jgi:hypothetical protein
MESEQCRSWIEMLGRLSTLNSLSRCKYLNIEGLFVASLAVLSQFHSTCSECGKRQPTRFGAEIDEM